MRESDSGMSELWETLTVGAEVYCERERFMDREVAHRVRRQMTLLGLDFECGAVPGGDGMWWFVAQETVWRKLEAEYYDVLRGSK